MIRRRRVGSPVLATAAVGAVAYSAGSSAAKSAAREQQQNARIAQLEQQQQAPPPVAAAPAAPAPPPAPMNTDQKIAQLKELGALRDAGILTEAEFAVEKQKILAGA